MAIDFDMSGIIDYEDFHKNKLELEITKAMIHILHKIGITNITSKNVNEVYFRMRLLASIQSGQILNVKESTNGHIVRFFPSFNQVERRTGLIVYGNQYSETQFLIELRKTILDHKRQYPNQEWFTA
jgi:hypothetical protein